MFSSLHSLDSGSLYLNRYAAQMGALARERDAQSALMVTQEKAEIISKRLSEVIEQTAQESDYLVSMSGRLRTLLNAIMGFSSMMEKESQGPLQDAYKSYAADIHSSGQEVMDLIEGFNKQMNEREQTTEAAIAEAVAEAPAPQETPEEDNDLLEAIQRPPVAELDVSRFSVTDVIRDAYAEVRDVANERQVKIRARLGRDLPDIVGDRGLLRSMLTHLIGVAIDGAISGAEVDFIASRDEEGALRFAVDSSIHNTTLVAKGIARQHWEWITEIMHRHGGSFGLEGDPKRHFLAVATLPAARTGASAGTA